MEVSTMSLTLCLLVIVGAIQVHGLYGPGPIVSTANGDYLGESFYFSENQYLNYSGYFNYFKGMAYAKPPVGDLRFRPPEKAAPWSDAYNATYFRNACPQRGPLGMTSNTEDCLYLDVLIPARNLTGAAVMVWFHAGQYRFGSGSSDYSWGVPLLAAAGGDVIFVTLNFRLGVIGFQTTGDDVSPGNYGLMDQRMALNWVYENIEAFGGDPKRVTIFGASTGAGSVSGQLLTSPESDLFQRAILQSGTMFASSAMIELNISHAIEVNKYVAYLVGCETKYSTEMVECLRNTSVDAILDAQKLVEEHFEVPQRYTLFYPVVDGKFIPDVPENLVERGEFNKVDILLGVNENEGISWLRNIYSTEEINAEEAPFMNRTFFTDLLEESFPNYNKLYIDSLEQEYTDWKYSGYPDYNYLHDWAKISTDEFFQCPTDVTARAYAGAGKNVFRYVNTHVPSRAIRGTAEPEWYGVSHLQEGPFVFGWEFNTLFEPRFNQTEEEVLMSLEVMRYWTNFAKTGNPNMAEINVTNVAEPWPLFTVPGLEYKELSPEMENERAVDARACAFWANYLPKVSLFTDDLADLEEDWRNSYYDWKNVALNEWQTAFDEYKKVVEPCT